MPVLRNRQATFSVALKILKVKTKIQEESAVVKTIRVSSSDWAQSTYTTFSSSQSREKVPLKHWLKIGRALEKPTREKL